jgi:two-component system alkaline phosphatase synthesis response regulator PhoP
MTEESVVRQEKTVVVAVEDDYYVLDFLKFALEQHGYEVHPASDGEQGLSLIQTYGPNLVILDLMLPKIDGFTILKKMSEDPKTQGTPVVVLSAYVTSESTRRMIKAQKNVREIFTKPVHLPEFIARLREILSAT